MVRKNFIYEIPRLQKAFPFIQSVLILLVGAGVLYSLYIYLLAPIPFVMDAQNWVISEINQVTVFGLFLMGLLGSLFIFPIPIDPLFIFGLQQGNPAILAIVLVFVGSFIGNYIDYWLGIKFSKYAIHFISLEQMYKAKRWVNKYGAFAVFLFNLTPLPASVLTFALGIAKYNLTRLMFFFSLGVLTKFIVIALVYNGLLSI